MTDPSVPSWNDLDARPIPSWWTEAKFGLFVHWGVYSVPAWRGIVDGIYSSYAEWYYASVYGPHENHDPGFHQRMYGEGVTYRDLAGRFTAELFDPTAWADTFAASGARYVVTTTKHHDGFCMWPTSNPRKRDWNAGAVGPRRDLVGELTEAVRAQGLRAGIYYSIPEWEVHPSHRRAGGYFIPETDQQRYGSSVVDYPSQTLWPELRELVERYRPCVLFADGGEWDLAEEYVGTRRLLAWLRSEVSDIVVNDRFHVGMPGRHGDYYSTEYDDVDRTASGHPWEESRGIGRSYGYNRAERAGDYASTADLLAMMMRTFGLGGNVLLNVGPTADGRIPELQEERLREVGAWLATFGDAVYGSTGGGQGRDGYYRTVKGSVTFVVVPRWEPAPLLLTGVAGATSIRRVDAVDEPEWRVDGDTATVLDPTSIPRHPHLPVVYQVEVGVPRMQAET